MMAAIIYAAWSKSIRRIVVPDDDDEGKLLLHLDKGEGIVIVGAKDDRAPVPTIDAGNRPILMVADNGMTVPDLERCKELVELATGVAPTDPRCVVVDEASGAVVDAIMADPEIDAHPAGYLVRSARAIIGDVHLDKEGTFLRLHTDGEIRTLEYIEQEGKAVEAAAGHLTPEEFATKAGADAHAAAKADFAKSDVALAQDAIAEAAIVEKAAP